MKWRRVISLCITFALFVFPLSIAQASDPPLNPLPEPCKILTTQTFIHTKSGFPRDPDVMRSIGNVNILIVPIDFSDSQAPSGTVDKIREILQTDKVVNFFESVSENNLKLSFDSFPRVLRAPQTSDKYGNIVDQAVLINGEWSNTLLLREALNSSEFAIDLTRYDAVIGVITGGRSLSGAVALASAGNYGAITTQIGEIHNTITIGSKLLFSSNGKYGWRYLIHEIEHIMGIPDLYLYALDSDWLGKSVGAFGQMSQVNDSEADFLAWNRWLLGWLPDSSVFCLAMPQTILDLDLSPARDHTHRNQMAAIRLSDHEVLVIQGILKDGLVSTAIPGLLVYLVDSNIETGLGPVTIIPHANAITTAPLSPYLTDVVRFAQAPLLSTEYLIYKDILIENAGNERDPYVLSIYVGTAKDLRLIELNKVPVQIAPAKKVTIICIKGKVKKKITALKPVCPTHYKKVSLTKEKCYRASPFVVMGNLRKCDIKNL